MARKRRANGEGSLRKRKDGRWEGHYTVGHDPETSMYELYYLDIATGLRCGELLGLKWTDVDFDCGFLKIQ